MATEAIHATKAIHEMDSSAPSEEGQGDAPPKRPRLELDRGGSDASWAQQQAQQRQLQQQDGVQAAGAPGAVSLSSGAQVQQQPPSQQQQQQQQRSTPGLSLVGPTQGPSAAPAAVRATLSPSFDAKAYFAAVETGERRAWRSVQALQDTQLLQAAVHGHMHTFRGDGAALQPKLTLLQQSTEFLIAVQAIPCAMRVASGGDNCVIEMWAAFALEHTADVLGPQAPGGLRALRDCAVTQIALLQHVYKQDPDFGKHFFRLYADELQLLKLHPHSASVYEVLRLLETLGTRASRKFVLCKPIASEPSCPYELNWQSVQRHAEQLVMLLVTGRTHVISNAVSEGRIPVPIVQKALRLWWDARDRLEHGNPHGRPGLTVSMLSAGVPGQASSGQTWEVEREAVQRVESGTASGGTADGAAAADSVPGDAGFSVEVRQTALECLRSAICREMPAGVLDLSALELSTLSDTLSLLPQLRRRIEHAVLERLPVLRRACRQEVEANNPALADADVALRAEQLLFDRLLQDFHAGAPSDEELKRGVGVAASSDRASTVAVDPRLLSGRLAQLLNGVTMTRLPVHLHAQMQAIEEIRQQAQQKQRALAAGLVAGSWGGNLWEEVWEEEMEEARELESATEAWVEHLAVRVRDCSSKRARKAAQQREAAAAAAAAGGNGSNGEAVAAAAAAGGSDGDGEGGSRSDSDGEGGSSGDSDSGGEGDGSSDGESDGSGGGRGAGPKLNQRSTRFTDMLVWPPVLTDMALDQLDPPEGSRKQSPMNRWGTSGRQAAATCRNELLVLRPLFAKRVEALTLLPYDKYVREREAIGWDAAELYKDRRLHDNTIHAFAMLFKRLRGIVNRDMVGALNGLAERDSSEGLSPELRQVFDAQMRPGGNTPSVLCEACERADARSLLDQLCKLGRGRAAAAANRQYTRSEPGGAAYCLPESTAAYIFKPKQDGMLTAEQKEQDELAVDQGFTVVKEATGAAKGGNYLRVVIPDCGCKGSAGQFHISSGTDDIDTGNALYAAFSLYKSSECRNEQGFQHSLLQTSEMRQKINGWQAKLRLKMGLQE